MPVDRGEAERLARAALDRLIGIARPLRRTLSIVLWLALLGGAMCWSALARWIGFDSGWTIGASAALLLLCASPALILGLYLWALGELVALPGQLRELSDKVCGWAQRRGQQPAAPEKPGKLGLLWGAARLSLQVAEIVELLGPGSPILWLVNPVMVVAMAYAAVATVLLLLLGLPMLLLSFVLG